MSANLVRPRPSRSSSVAKPSVPSIIIPPTPVTISADLDAKIRPPYSERNQPKIISVTCPTPTSLSDTSTLNSQMPAIKANARHKQPDVPLASCVNADILAMADVFSTMKRTLGDLSASFDILGQQTEKMSSLAPALKATEQLKELRSLLARQIVDQEAAMQETRSMLEDAVKGKVVEHIRSQLYAMIEGQVAKAVKERVRQQLTIKIPQDLCQQGHSHPKEVVESQMTLHNSEARRYNASLTAALPNQPLRPLLRPLPTPAQSPVFVISKTLPVYDSPEQSPISPRPRVPAPTPIASSAPYYFPHGSMSKGALDVIPSSPTPSPLFPRDLNALFSLGADTARTLLQEYGLGGTSDESPMIMRGATITPITGNWSSTCTPSREDNLTKFMAHIGVSA
ncbi:hypothetical protein BD779DRAFT_144886 [Infundibulicybe gibba]|nr:hypothetical protein BD779DRAFT_144886 [Infundibulicybe gibba]